MATDQERLVLQMSADLRSFEREMARSRQVADRRLREVEQRAMQADKNLSRIMGNAGRGMSDALRSGLAGIAPTLAAAFSTQAVIQYADAYTGLQNRLRAAGLEGAALRRVEDQLYEAANRNGVAVQATAELYQRATMARENLGASEAQLLALVSGTTAALKLQGTSAGEASGALLQLGQLLGGNKVQAQEYNSLIDGLPTLLQAVANGSDRWGGSVARLTQDVKASKVTTQEFFQAALKGFGDIQGAADGAALTVGAALQTLNNELGRYIGQTDQNLSATQRLAAGIEMLANNLDDVVMVAQVAATIIGGGYAGALTLSTARLLAASIATVRLTGFNIAMTASMTGATRAQVALNAAIAANPVGAAALAVGVLTAAIVLAGNALRITGRETREVKLANDALKASTDAYTEAANAAAVASGREAASAKLAAAEKRAQAVANREAAAAKLAEARATIALIQAEAQRQLDAERFNIRGDRPGSVRTIGREQQQRLADAQAEVESRQAAITAAVAAIAEADAALARRAPAAPSESPSSSRSGPSADQIAAARERLDLEERLAAVRATGDEAAIKAEEERQRIIRLTEEYRSAGYADAVQRATAMVALENQAVMLAEERALAEEEAAAFSERARRSADAWAEQHERAAEADMERLRFAAEIARLGGSEAEVQAAERRLWIEERVAELKRTNEKLSADAARDQAESEWSAYNSAERTGQLRDEFRESFRDGIKAAIDGDLGGFFESLADRFTDRMLDNLADDLFDLLNDALKGANSGGGSGNWLSAIGSAVFGGFRAGGGPVSAGRAYVVGEKRPEVFVPNVSGTIIPSVNAAAARVQNSSANAQPTPVNVVLEVGPSPYFDVRVQQVAGPMVARGTQASVEIVKRSGPSWQHQDRMLRG